MSEDINQNWLEAFKVNIKCGSFPAKSSNPEMEMLTGYVGIAIERGLCKCPDMLENESDSIFIEQRNPFNLSYWYERIKCGQFFESLAQGLAVLAMLEAARLECCDNNIYS